MTETVVQRISDEDPEGDDVFGDHCWHYRYNRRLCCFQNCVTSLTFSHDGQYLVSGTGSGDIKIWDTAAWAERAKLKGCKKEEPRALAISPGQRWLVVAHSSSLSIYSCKPPWRLEHVMPAPIDVATKEISEWHGIAFSPTAEVDHPNCQAGQDNHLAAFASNVLCVLDYSGGWSCETPKRTRSVFNSSQPTSIAYTACGFWLVCGYECGQLQIWNHFSLTLERTFSAAHNGSITSITASPRAAEYDPRFVSCSIDRTLRVWHSAGWCLEQIVPDTKADRNGIRCCTFSSTGNWLVSVATELCLWAVCVSAKGELELRLHQRLASVCGAEGLRIAAFCSQEDAISVGSRDGVLGLFMKLPGLPPESKARDVATPNKIRTKSDGNGVTAWIMDRPLAKPMKHVSPAGNETMPDDDRRTLQSSQWFVRSDLRSLKRAAACSQVYTGRATKSSPVVTPDIRAKLLGGRSRKATLHDLAQKAEPEDTTLENSASAPDLKRWKPKGYGLEDMLKTYCHATDMSPVSTASNLMNKTVPPGFWGGRSRNNSSNSTGSLWGIDGELSTADEANSLDMNDISSVKKAILERHKAQSTIRRISLDPQSIC